MRRHYGPRTNTHISRSRIPMMNRTLQTPKEAHYPMTGSLLIYLGENTGEDLVQRPTTSDGIFGTRGVFKTDRTCSDIEFQKRKLGSTPVLKKSEHIHDRHRRRVLGRKHPQVTARFLRFGPILGIEVEDCIPRA